MKVNDTVEDLKKLIKPIIEENKYELYDVQYKRDGSRWLLCIFVDNETRNIGLDECAFVSRSIGEVIDAHTTDLPPYTLEVSSPGLDRLLKKDSDFLWAMNKTLKVKFINKENKKETIEGKILSLDDINIEIEVPKNPSVFIPKDKIDTAKRVMKFDEIMPKNHKD